MTNPLMKLVKKGDTKLLKQFKKCVKRKLYVSYERAARDCGKKTKVYQCGVCDCFHIKKK